ncbi:hypothetical protein DNTS_015622, partial [Danionella cerebrum]
DGEEFSMFPTENLEEVCCLSNGDLVPLAPSIDLPSPGLSGEAVSPSPFHPSFQSAVYEDGMETLPTDFELRESAVTRGTLGVWTRRRLEVDEQLGPYGGMPRHSPENGSQAWEVGSNT